MFLDRIFRIDRIDRILTGPRDLDRHLEEAMPQHLVEPEMFVHESQLASNGVVVFCRVEV